MAYQVSTILKDLMQSLFAYYMQSDLFLTKCLFKPETDGRKLLALKFVEAVTLLYTADPSASTEPPENHTSGGIFVNS